MSAAFGTLANNGSRANQAVIATTAQATRTVESFILEGIIEVFHDQLESSLALEDSQEQPGMC